MMNIQNPASYPTQQAYSDYGNAMAQPGVQPSSYPNDFSQNQFQQSFPQTPQRPNHFPQQPGSQIPPHVYQQLQQQQQGFVRPQSRGNNGMTPVPQQRRSPSNNHHIQAQNQNQNQNQNQSQQSRTIASQISTTTPHLQNNMAMAAQMQQAIANPLLAQQVQMQNTAQQMNRPASSQQPQAGNQVTNQPGPTPLSPQSAAREKARVTVLLEINSYLLQEVVSLQSQGKAGHVKQVVENPNQQSPTSPASAAVTDSANTFSPTDPTSQAKAAPPSKEYQECMRRLQANLSYLAAIADAKKRPEGKVPLYPTIISPPPHLKEVHELYKKLATLFPEASLSKTNQAIAFASAQHQQGLTGNLQQMSQQLGTGGGTNIGPGKEQLGQHLFQGQGQV